MTPERRMDDERLARLIGSVGAEADPAVLARARARIAVGARTEGWELFAPVGVAWLFRPLALTTAAAACVLALVAGVWFAGDSGTGSAGSSMLTSSETLPGALLDELDTGSATPGNGVSGDSGGPS